MSTVECDQQLPAIASSALWLLATALLPLEVGTEHMGTKQGMCTGQMCIEQWLAWSTGAGAQVQEQICTDWLGLQLKMCTDQEKGQKGQLVPAALDLTAS